MAGGMLGDLSHEELMQLRAQPGADQGMLAPFEHRAFAREWAKESPIMAGLSLPAAIPAYAAAKALGLQGARTPASLDQLFAGYHGYAEGMLDRLIPSAQAQNYATIPPQAPSMLENLGQWLDERKAARGRYWAGSEAAAAAPRKQNPAPSRAALKHLYDIFVRGKQPSRDPSTWNDRTGAEDEAYEKEQRYQDSIKAHRTKARFTGTRG